MSSWLEGLAKNDPDPEERNLVMIDLKRAIERRLASKMARAEEFNRRSLELQAEKGLSEMEAHLEVVAEMDAEKKRLYGDVRVSDDDHGVIIDNLRRNPEE